MSYALRRADLGEAPWLLEIEDLSGRLYAEAGLPPDLEGLDSSALEEAIRAETVWVVADASDRPVGFAMCLAYPHALHLRELDVLPEHMRRGLGRRLVDHVCEQARGRELDAVTLTTFVEVSWNRPLYERWGFSVIAAADMPSWLAEIRAEEDRTQLGRWPRCAMARRLTSR